MAKADKGKESSLSHRTLKECLHYCTISGDFTWIKKTHPCVSKIKLGDIAGTITRFGYRYIQFFGRRYMAHRLAWFYVYGVWPKNTVDHINRVKSDNHLANLREASIAENCFNKTKLSVNTSGFKGVSWHKHRQKWIASIDANGIKRHLGYYSTPEQAFEAYCLAAEKYHKEFARTE